MAGPASAPLVNLVFGETRSEVSSEVGGSLEALTAEVEAKFGLHPDSFSIHDDFGKVEDSNALQRALDMAGGKPCVLQVCEAPQWKKIREMDAKIKLLIARCPIVDNCLMDIEERTAQRFETVASVIQVVDERSTLAAAELTQRLEELDSKVSKSIAPLLQSVALQDMELKAKLDSLDASILAQEFDTKVNRSIVPMLQNMALQQMDLKEKIDGFDSIQDTHKELSEKFDEMQNEMGSRGNNIQEAREQLKALQVEVQNLSEQPATGAHAWGQILSAAQQDLCKSPKNPKNGLGGFGQWSEGSRGDSFSPIAYSKKSQINSMNTGGGVQFATFVAPRQLDRFYGSRSLPTLPPVK